MFWIWVDARVPYYQLSEGVKMPNEKYREIVEELIDEIKKVRFILTSPEPQKTVRASHLVELIESQGDEEKKLF